MNRRVLRVIAIGCILATSPGGADVSAPGAGPNAQATSQAQASPVDSQLDKQVAGAADNQAATQTAQAGDRDQPLPPLSELLERSEVDPQSYSERCISTRRIRSHQVLDSQHLVFEMHNDRRYLVQFPRRCFGLRRGDPISYETHSGRLCKLDSVRPLEYRGRGMERGMPCYIKEFQQVSLEQIDYLKEALKARRDARRR